MVLNPDNCKTAYDGSTGQQRRSGYATSSPLECLCKEAEGLGSEYEVSIFLRVPKP